jgi:hypothetical protein
MITFYCRLKKMMISSFAEDKKLKLRATSALLIKVLFYRIICLLQMERETLRVLLIYFSQTTRKVNVVLLKMILYLLMMLEKIR